MTSGNSFFAHALGSVLIGASLLAPAPALAGTAPAMAEVKEMVVEGLRSARTSRKDSCDINPENLQNFLVKTLKNYGLPAFSVIEAKPSRMDTARIELLPEVVTSNTQEAECTSWVSLTAESQNTLVVPPVEMPRSVVVTYWRGGMMVSSGESTHARVVADAYDKLSRQLAAQYNRDQPPVLPDFGEQKPDEFVIPNK